MLKSLTVVTLLGSALCLWALGCEMGGDFEEFDDDLEAYAASGTQCAVVNERAAANLACPSGQVIDSITFASYGTPTGSCPNFGTSACHASTSKSKVESLCLNKQTCSVGANNGVFGDPCGGTPKKLAVAFTCKIVGSTSTCAQAPEASTASLSCPSGQVIGAITFASYGTPTGSCPSFGTGACHASTSKSKVESLCLNKQTCSVGANNGVFGDPCGGTPKKIAVAFTCKSVGSTSTSSACAQVGEGSTASLSCPSGQVVKTISFASYGTPSGSCPSFVKGTCHSSNSQSKVESLCLNKGSCSVSANNAVFGDPCSGTPKKLAVAYSCGSGGTVPTGGDMPVFLLAGQSNMEGNVDQTLFNQLMAELGTGASGTLQQRLVDRLTSWYRNNNGGYAMYGYSAQKVALEASELIRLSGAGLVNASLTNPNAKVMCSATNSAPQALALNCGNPFGPELLLGRVLGTTAYSPTSLIKVAKGGTSLKVDWLPPSAASRTGQPVGTYYKQLSQRIKSLQANPASVHPNCTGQKCRWAAFIWFQGENDTFDAAYAQAYQQNLVHLISDVRSEIGSPQLPVIIVKIGAWAQSMDYGKTVAAAQTAVVSADPRAALVVTDDLSGFYHYDPAAQLIIGERIAKALIPMLK